VNDQNFGGETNLREDAQRLFSDMGFAAEQKREVWEAFQEAADGVERCALRAQAIGKREGRSGAGLLLAMLRAEDHLCEFAPNTPLPTGWRWVRGLDGQAGTFVEDPAGTDKPPVGYDFATRSPILPRDADPDAVPLSPDVWAQLERLRSGRAA
jgi:hypothetical protein